MPAGSCVPTQVFLMLRSCGKGDGAVPNVVLEPCRLDGVVRVPASKSMGHRYLIAAALAEGESRIDGLGTSRDIEATRACLATLRNGGDSLPTLDCGESGSTLRFLIPVALALRGGGRFTGHGRLMERPQEPYRALFQPRGIHWEQEGDFLTVQGRLTAGRYQLPGNVSSQFITGLLFALPLLPGESRVEVTSPLESEGYVAMTLEVLERFGIRVERRAATFEIPGDQHYRPCSVEVEGDWSQAAVWYAANFLDHRIRLEGLNENSCQGDRQVAALYWKLARPGEVEIDVSQCPDLAPALGAMAAMRRGTARFTGAGRLRIKESDRLSAIVATVNALGGAAEEGADSLTIRGVEHLRGGVTVDSWNDHRIAMMAAVLATRCEKPVTLLGMQCVEKSYPDFWEHYRMLGGRYHVV